MLVAELVLTALFVLVILGATARAASPAMGGLAIGLMLTLIHLVSIPISNTSVNPARSTAVAVVAALFGDGATTPLGQLWLFWVAPIAGAVPAVCSTSGPRSRHRPGGGDCRRSCCTRSGSGLELTSAQSWRVSVSNPNTIRPSGSSVRGAIMPCWVATWVSRNTRWRALVS